MLDIQMKQLENAVRTLNLLKCEYAIKLPDGSITGTLPVAEPPKSKRNTPRHDYSCYSIPERLRNMLVGDVDVYVPQDGHPIEGIRSSISAAGSKLFGAGNFTTTVVNGEVQCMRLA